MVNSISHKFISLKEKDLVYVVGVSGGPDSMFLLDKMRRLKYKFVVAHVNYGKRENSDIDENIVRKYCWKNKIEFFLAKPKKFPTKTNFQAFARDFRYDFFLEVCKEICLKDRKNNSFSIVVAHNFEDLIETYYIQRKRRSFVNFWGLPFQSYWKEAKVYRPIITFTKQKILSYLKEKDIDYANDYTNEQEIYLRNIFRKDIMLMSLDSKKLLLSEINCYNDDLLKEMNNFKLAYWKIVHRNIIDLNGCWKNLSSDLKERIVYKWINDFSKNIFASRKKKIFLEIVKQFDSGSDILKFSFNNGFKIEKNRNSVFIIKNI